MSDHRVLLIENPAFLSIDIGRLKIARPEQPDAFILPRDIAVLCLHHYSIALSVHVLKELAAAGAVVVVTDEKHLPSAMLLPVVGNGFQSLRLRQQMALENTDAARHTWQQLVQAKIRTHAATLRALGRNGALRLERLAEQVEPGDRSHIEGQAARHYWEFLFEEDFTRRKQGADDPINARLNFGYAALRSLIARELVCAGLNPVLGVGHYSSENPFNLADDFIEPYRHLVEQHVAEDDSRMDELTPAARKQTLAFIQRSVSLKGNDYRLPAAIAESVASFLRLLDSWRPDRPLTSLQLVLPGSP